MELLETQSDAFLFHRSSADLLCTEEVSVADLLVAHAHSSAASLSQGISFTNTRRSNFSSVCHLDDPMLFKMLSIDMLAAEVTEVSGLE